MERRTSSSSSSAGETRKKTIRSGRKSASLIRNSHFYLALFLFAMLALLSILLGVLLTRDVAQAQADSPSAAPFPNIVYPGYANPAAVPGAQSGQKSPPFYPSPWMDGSGGWATAYSQAQTFVKKLTLAEKVNLTTGVGWQSERCVGQTGGVPRLGFRKFCMQDSPLGVRLTDQNSVFPGGVTLTATWSRSIVNQIAADMGAEHRQKGVDVQLGPVVGPLGRAPEGGRNWEGFGPDPYLAGSLVYESVQGIQSSGVIACTKHYIGNEQEHFRNSISSNIDDATMHEVYLWPFADAVRAGTGSVMCSYNRVNQSYGCQNSYTINNLLKRELGFQGFVMSDWSAQHAGVSTALAGLDMSMPGDEKFNSGTSYWGYNLVIAVLNGTVPEWRIDDMATRIVAAYYYVNRPANEVDINFSSWTNSTKGYAYYYSKTGLQVVNEHVNVQGNHAADIRTAAGAGTVLLKNVNKTLPLSTGQGLTGVFGEDAAANPNGPNACGDRGCDVGTLGIGWGSGTANYPYLVTPLSAITTKVGASNVQSATDGYNMAAIQSLASKSQVALVFVNTDSGEGYITVDGNQGDRNNLTFWQNGDSVIDTVAANCKNTVLIVHSPGAVLLTEWYQNPNITAIVWAGMPGQESGNSIVDVLYGAVNPGGKLPFTMGATREDYGTDILYKSNGQPQQGNFQEGTYIDYRAFDAKNTTPIYEFGYGLSYTTFSYSNLVVQAASATPYTPTTGSSQAAPVLGKAGTAASYVYPKGFKKLKDYIYPFLTSTNLKTASGDPSYGSKAFIPPGSLKGTPYPLAAAGGAPGGNPGLYTVLFTVSATIKNTGGVAGDEVPQLYVSLGGANQPPKVLRGFDRLTIPAGGTATFTAQLTRRDLSNWDTVSQNWVITSAAKTVYVGSSSRNLPLSKALPAVQ